ncbi:MAG TPA: hypothetical protein VKZ53_28085 [Candidatus Angelobacter sp.]|nr:hypothetical protein [Candidatus Angelobacter sp.]
MNLTFGEALARFEEFLANQGYPSSVIWVTPDDVLLSGSQEIFVKTPVSPQNEVSVRKIFDEGMRQELGVLFTTLCETGRISYAFAWTPKDDLDAQYALMPKDLKLSVGIGYSRRPGKEVESHIYWRFLQFKYRREQGIKRQVFYLD